MNKHPCAAAGRPTPNAIYPTDTARLGSAEAGSRAEQCRDGEIVWSAGRQAVAEVHRRGFAAGNQPAHPVFCDGSFGTGRSDGEQGALEDAGRRSEHRFERRGRVVQAVDSKAKAKIGFCESPLIIIRAALRDAALAQSDQAALNILGDALLVLAALANAEAAHG